MQVVVPVSQCKDTYNFDKTNIFSKNICLLLCFLGIFGDKKGQNTNIFLKGGCRWWCPLGAGGAGCACLHRVHLWQVVGFLAILLTLAKMDKIPAFGRFPAFACGVLCLNMALFRVLMGFLAWFGGFVWVRLAWVLCVACGAFVRVNS